MSSTTSTIRKKLTMLVLAAGVGLSIAGPVAVASAPPAHAIQMQDLCNGTGSGVLAYSGSTRITVLAGQCTGANITRVYIPARWAMHFTVTNRSTGGSYTTTKYGGTGGASLYLGTHDAVRVNSSWVYM